MMAKSERTTTQVLQAIRRSPRLFVCECYHHKSVCSATTAKFLFVIVANAVSFSRECRQGFSFRFRSAGLQQGDGLFVFHYFQLQLDGKL
jgi:hypothetical protein